VRERANKYIYFQKRVSDNMICILPTVPTSGSGFLSMRLLYCFHGRINYIDSKAKCRHLKKFTCKGTLRQVFIRYFRLQILSIILVFSAQLYISCSSNLLSGSTLPPPSLCQSTVNTESMWMGAVDSCWRQYSAGVYHSVADQIQNLQN
jgi:hypothetical protein